MSEFLQVFNSVFNVFSLVLVVFLIPFVKFVLELRTKVDRIEVLLNIILKDVEKLKEKIYNGKKDKD